MENLIKRVVEENHLELSDTHLKTESKYLTWTIYYQKYNLFSINYDRKSVSATVS